MSLSRLYQYSSFVTRFRIYDELSVDFGLQILDLRYSAFLIKWIERSDTADPKSEI